MRLDNDAAVCSIGRVYGDGFLDRLATRCTGRQVESAVVLRAFDLWAVGPVDDQSTSEVDLAMGTDAVDDAHRAIVDARHGERPVTYVDTSDRADCNLCEWAEVERPIRTYRANRTDLCRRSRHVGDVIVGQSGGPVVNASGEVIGIIYATSKDRKAVGFATDDTELRELIADRSVGGVANGQCP